MHHRAYITVNDNNKKHKEPWKNTTRNKEDHEEEVTGWDQRMTTYTINMRKT